MQVPARVPRSAGDADPPHGKRGGRPQIGTVLCLRDATKALGDPLGVVEVPFLEVHVDQEREQRSHHGRLADLGNLVVRASGGSLEHLTRLDLGQGEFERTASGRGVAIAQGRRAFFDQRRAHEPMMARPGGLLDRPKA
jgi:hypothetical protein